MLLYIEEKPSIAARVPGDAEFWETKTAPTMMIIVPEIESIADEKNDVTDAITVLFLPVRL